MREPFHDPPAPTLPEREHLPFALAVALIYAVVVAATTMAHEPWRDEYQAWLLARDATSLAGLFRALKYEGHPGLWHLLLYGITGLTRDPRWMQAAHVLISGAAVLLFQLRAPFVRWQRIAFAGGYFVMYEYAVVARNYSLGLLLVIVVCWLFPDRLRRPLPLCVALFLLAHSSVFGLVMSLAMLAALLVELLVLPQVSPPEARPSPAALFAGLGVLITGCATAVVQVIPPADSGYAVAWYLDFDGARLSALTRAMAQVLIPACLPDVDFWMRGWPERWPAAGLAGGVLALAVLALVAWLLRSRRVVAIFYVLTVVGLLGFYYVKLLGAPRHHGFVYLTMIAGLWLARTHETGGTPAHPRHSRVAQLLLSALVVCQLGGGGVSHALEWRYPFSQGRAAARFIVEAQLADLPLVVEPAAWGTTLVGALGRDSVYMARICRNGSYVKWTRALWRAFDDVELLRRTRQFARRQRGRVLLATDHALSDDHRQVLGARDLAHLVGSIAHEDYHLYLLEPLP
ncbi:MAG: hypothetical protein ABIJ09_22765 [Pseudomonadota bacterium]